MATFTDAAAVQLAGGHVNAAIFFRLALVDEPLRLWSGDGDFAIPADAVETGGATFAGTGALGNMPAVSQLINGQAERLTFTLSELNATAAALADAEAASARFKAVRLGVMILGPDWQPLSSAAWLWSGTADTPIVERQADANSVVRQVSLSVGSVFTGRRRPFITYYTDTDQQARSPGDRFCERVSLYAEDTVRQWPQF